MSAAAVNFYSAIDLTVASLANNHILDQKAQGVRSTLEALRMRDIYTVGAGMNICEAKKGLILEKNGLRIGIYACAQQEFSIAAINKAGANPFDPLESLDDIAELRTRCDSLIVLYHGGTETYPYPTPYLQRVCRRMADKGADLVVCQHSHCIGCEEVYRKSRIVYGQGNFILDNISEPCWKSGLIVSAVVTTDGVASVDYRVTTRKAMGVSINTDEQSEMKRFLERSNQILSNSFVEEMFEAYCAGKGGFYFIRLAGVSELARRILNRIGLTKLFEKRYGWKNRNLIYNYLTCDSHREAIACLCNNKREIEE